MSCQIACPASFLRPRSSATFSRFSLDCLTICQNAVRRETALVAKAGVFSTIGRNSLILRRCCELSSQALRQGNRTDVMAVEFPSGSIERTGRGGLSSHISRKVRCCGRGLQQQPWQSVAKARFNRKLSGRSGRMTRPRLWPKRHERNLQARGCLARHHQICRDVARISVTPWRLGPWKGPSGLTRREGLSRCPAKGDDAWP